MIVEIFLLFPSLKEITLFCERYPQMRQITVSTKVFSLIWAARQAGEESENDILLRLLSGTGAQLATSNHPKETVQELNMSVSTLSVPASLRHAYWWQVVEFVLEKTGRPQSLSEIYRGVTAVCKELDRHMPQELEATVRGTLEDNSADSERHKGVRDIFCMPEGKHAGIWAIRRKK